MVANFAALFNCTTMDWASDSKMARTKAIIWLGLEHFLCCFWGSTGDLHFLQISSGAVCQSRHLQLLRNTSYMLGLRLCFFVVLNCYLFVNRDDSLAS